MASSPHKNYYQILEISPDASALEVRSNYHKLALQYHPDRNPGNPQAEERFKEINMAYQILSDAARRATYNEQLRNPTLPDAVQNRPTTPEPAKNRPTPPKVDTKNERGRYFKMTVTQISILAGSAVFGLLIVGVIMMLVLSSNAKPAATATARATRIVAATNTPTLTPIPVIATRIPPSGWVEFKTKNATLWLPPSFVGGDMLDGKQDSINKVTKLGRYYKYIADSMKTADKEVVLWMVDKTPRQTAFNPVITVWHETNMEDTDLDAYIKKWLEGDSSEATPTTTQVTINENKKMIVLGRPAKRLILSALFVGFLGVELVDIAYFIKDGADIWVVEAYSTPEEYIYLLSDFEKSMETFNIIP